MLEVEAIFTPCHGLNFNEVQAPVRSPTGSDAYPKQQQRVCRITLLKLQRVLAIGCQMRFYLSASRVEIIAEQKVLSHKGVESLAATR